MCFITTEQKEKERSGYRSDDTRTPSRGTPLWESRLSWRDRKRQGESPDRRGGSDSEKKRRQSDVEGTRERERFKYDESFMGLDDNIVHNILAFKCQKLFP